MTVKPPFQCRETSCQRGSILRPDPLKNPSVAVKALISSSPTLFIWQEEEPLHSHHNYARMADFASTANCCHRTPLQNQRRSRLPLYLHDWHHNIAAASQPPQAIHTRPEGALQAAFNAGRHVSNVAEYRGQIVSQIRVLKLLIGLQRKGKESAGHAVEMEREQSRVTTQS